MRQPDAHCIAPRRVVVPAALLPLLMVLLLLTSGCVPRMAPPGPGLAALDLSVPTLTDKQFITADGTTLPLRHWAPPEGTAAHGVLLALHGFNDYSHAFAQSGPALAASGLQVYAYDQRGFGEAPHRGLWPGVDTLTSDLATAAGLLRQRYPDLPLYLLGESMGGAVVLAALAGPQPPETAGAILAAPAIWARPTMPFHQRAALWIGSRLFPWARFSGRGLGIQASDNIEMLIALGRDPLFIKETRVDAVYGLANLMDAALRAGPQIDETPILLLYGARDEVVPVEPTFQLWNSLPASTAAERRFAYYPEGWHMLLRDLQAEVVIGDIAAWTRDRQGTLPSGAEDYAAAALARVAAGEEPGLPDELPGLAAEEAGSARAAAACEGITC